MGKLSVKDWAGIAKALGAGKPFRTTGELRGVDGGAGFLGTGRLPTEWWADAEGAAYVVYSHQTPIAWRLANGWWVRPLVTYSVTTTRYQETVDAAIGYVAPERVDDPAHEGARVRK